MFISKGKRKRKTMTSHSNDQPASTDSVTLDAQTAREIRRYLIQDREYSWPKEWDRHGERSALFDKWIAALTPAPRIVPDGPFDEYFDGSTE